MEGGNPVPVLVMYLAKLVTSSAEDQRVEAGPMSSTPGRQRRRMSALAGHWRIAWSRVSSPSSQNGQVVGASGSSQVV
jgi:hypothetical protein